MEEWAKHTRVKPRNLFRFTPTSVQAAFPSVSSLGLSSTDQRVRSCSDEAAHRSMEALVGGRLCAFHQTPVLTRIPSCNPAVAGFYRIRMAPGFFVP